MDGYQSKQENQSKVFDCFMFAGEYSALQIRLHELNDVIDKFIIVEGNQTFRSVPKPIFLDVIWDNLAPWHDRIHRVIVKDWPQTDDPWELEHFQREQIRRGLEELEVGQEDLIIVGDADEIPRASVVKKVNVWSGPVHFDMPTYYFRLNWKVPDRWNQGGRPFAALRVQMGSVQEMRDKQKRLAIDAGWHFSYLNNAEDIKTKIQSFSHSEYDTIEYTDIEHLIKCAREGLDPFNRFELEPVEVDDTYPQWVLENRDNLKYLFR